MSALEKHFGATKKEWNHFAVMLGLEEDLLPCVSNPNAPIAPKSKMKKVGKTPSRYNQKGEVVGLTDWTDKKATVDDADRWERNPDYGICLQTRRVRAIDVDITDQAVADKITGELIEIVGRRLPTRIRSNSSKFVVAFTLEGEYHKRIIRTNHGIIEFLATGQQFVVAGTHESGVRYEWLGGLPDDMPVIDGTTYEKIFEHLAEHYAIEPPTKAKQRNEKVIDDAITNDPVAKFLDETGRVLSTGREGQLFIECPFKDDHTGDSGETETAYFCAGTRDYKQGHFKCLHAHCASRVDDEFLNAFGYGAQDYEDVSTPEEPAEPAEPKKEEPKKKRFELIRADEYVSREKPDYLIKGIMYRHSAGMTYGGSGDGKTFVVLDMACAIALGVPWNGRKVKRGRVVYVCAEGAGGFMSRIQAYAKYHEVDLHDLGDYLSIVAASPNFLKKEDVQELGKAIIAKYPDVALIVVDTLAQTSTGADENSAKDMTLMLKHVEYLRDQTGASSELVHHTGKDEERGARGSTALKADCDFQYSVSRDGPKRLFWVAKMKDGLDNFGWNFTLQTVELYADEDGEMVTSCVVVYEEEMVKERSKPSKKPQREDFQKETVHEIVESGEFPTIDAIKREVLRVTPHSPDQEKQISNSLYKLLGEMARDGDIEIDGQRVIAKLNHD